MKTAISIPDDVFAAAEETAKGLGMSRSEFYTRAVRAYLKRKRRRLVTESINAILDEIGDEGVDPLLMQMQLASLPHEAW
ncbi:MAG: hypothetical protein HY319_01455 [Armatimonadetes bacterium]|nr:hypothetical protein [Armatimonadota bacterium]